VLGIEAQLDATADQRLIDGIAMPATETEAVWVTRRTTDQRKASRSSDGSAACSGPALVKRSMGIWPVSACTRVPQH